MTGTLLNMATILIGSLIGILIGNRLSEKVHETVITGLGCVTLVIGVQSAMETGNILLPLLALAIGAIIGETLDLDAGLKSFGGWLQKRFAGGESAGDSVSAEINRAQQARLRFINGFVTASLVFCIGPLAVLGSIQNGMNVNDVRLLAIKSTLDFFAATAFAASLGIGVAFSIIPTFFIQGAFSLVGVLIMTATANPETVTLSASNPFIVELSATGGLILIGLALVLLNLKVVRVANFLPALLIAPLLIFGAGLVGINIYPLR